MASRWQHCVDKISSESKLRESNEEIQRVQHSVQKLRKLVDNKNLGERSDLTKQLNTSQDRLYDCEKKNSVSTVFLFLIV